MQTYDKNNKTNSTNKTTSNAPVFVPKKMQMQKQSNHNRLRSYVKEKEITLNAAALSNGIIGNGIIRKKSLSSFASPNNKTAPINVRVDVHEHNQLSQNTTPNGHIKYSNPNSNPDPNPNPNPNSNSNSNPSNTNNHHVKSSSSAKGLVPSLSFRSILRQKTKQKSSAVIGVPNNVLKQQLETVNEETANETIREIDGDNVLKKHSVEHIIVVHSSPRRSSLKQDDDEKHENTSASTSNNSNHRNSFVVIDVPSPQLNNKDDISTTSSRVTLNKTPIIISRPPTTLSTSRLSVSTVGTAAGTRRSSIFAANNPESDEFDFPRGYSRTSELRKILNPEEEKEDSLKRLSESIINCECFEFNLNNAAKIITALVFIATFILIIRALTKT